MERRGGVGGGKASVINCVTLRVGGYVLNQCLLMQYVERGKNRYLTAYLQGTVYPTTFSQNDLLCLILRTEVESVRGNWPLWLFSFWSPPAPVSLFEVAWCWYEGGGWPLPVNIEVPEVSGAPDLNRRLPALPSLYKMSRFTHRQFGSFKFLLLCLTT